MFGKIPLLRRDCVFASSFVDDDGAPLQVRLDAFDIPCETGNGALKGFDVTIQRATGTTSTTAVAELHSIADILDIPLVRGATARVRVQTKLLDECFGIVAWSTYRHKAKYQVNRGRVFLGIAERSGQSVLIIGSRLSYEELPFHGLAELRGVLTSSVASNEPQFMAAQDCLITQFAERCAADAP